MNKDKSISSPISPKRIHVFDSTLRERTFGVSFSTGEKLSIASLLDGIGISYIESTFSVGNPSEAEYLKQLASILKGSTQPVIFLSDPAEAASLSSSSGSWVRNVSVRTSAWKSKLWDERSNKKEEPEANLVSLKKKLIALNTELKKQLFLRVEHFFDGFFEDTAYALGILEVAVDNGVKKLILEDSRGASLPDQISKAVKLTGSHFASTEDLTVGIHCHNDLGLAVSNTISAVQAGASLVQGTINGIGERAGSADLCQVLPLLELRLGYESLNSRLPREQQLLTLKALSDKVALATGYSQPHQPFVGAYAFAHTDPNHVAVEVQNHEAFEAVNPGAVGNHRLLGVDDASIVKSEMSELGLYALDKDEVAKKVLLRLRELEAFGCKFEDAKASLHLLILDSLGYAIWPFQVTRWQTRHFQITR